jgi:glucokinase
MSTNRVIGVDLGGTKILAGVVERDGTVLHHRETPTPVTSQADLLAGLQTAVEELMDDSIAAVGFGVPTRVNHVTGRVEGRSVNIPLEGFDFREFMSERFGLPVGVENDGNAAALAEQVAGAGRGELSMLMLTLGTGCGGGVVFDGKLFRGWAEFGHIVVEYDGLPCQGSCTGRGHLEPYVTGVAATLLAQQAFGPAVDAHRLVRLANEGDEEARAILAGIGRRLGAGIGSLINIFGSELVVIGGGFGRAAYEWLRKPATEIARRDALTPGGERLRLNPGELGTMAGLVGAGLVAFEATGLEATA